MHTCHPIPLFGGALVVNGPPLPSNSEMRMKWISRIRAAAQRRLRTNGYEKLAQEDYAIAVGLRVFIGTSRFPRFDVQNIAGHVANALQRIAYGDDTNIFRITAEKFLVLDCEQRIELTVDVVGRWRD
jgi:Holliday junction resolvase RusA-like endonuclease